MDCDRLREVLIEHVDGLLGGEEAGQARTHLAECASCRLLQEEVRRNFAALDTWEEEDLPAGAFERLSARLPAGPSVLPAASSAPASRSWGRVFVPYAAGLATAAAAMALFLVPNEAVFLSPRPSVPAAGPHAVARDSAPAASPTTGTGGVALVSTDAGHSASTSTSPAHAPRRGERPLTFKVADQGILRSFLLPEGVDPTKIMLVDDERPIPNPGGVR